MISVYTPLALKLHSFGLVRMFDSEWCGENLYQHFKRPYRGQAEPVDLFKKTIIDGFLPQLGYLLFDEFLNDEEWFEMLNGIERLEYIDDLVEALENAEVPADSPLLAKASTFVQGMVDLYEADDDKYYERCDRRKFKGKLARIRQRLVATYGEAIGAASEQYASNYANRVFHDRELCGYLANLILEIGIDGTGLDEAPSQWVNRLKLPEWAKKSIIARDRGHCAQCDAGITLELNEESHFDHIVPISKGGCNDLVNYQLLCSNCNLKKTNNELPVRTSIPRYMKFPK